MKAKVQSRNCEKAAEEAEAVKASLTKGQQNAMEQGSERGASTWLTFQLNKQAFRDAFCLRYGWTPERLPSHCPCGEVFSVAHAFSCPKGALPSTRHNRVRDITAQLLTNVCPNVGTEPTLQPLSGESFPLKSTDVEEGARLDVQAHNFWDNSKGSAYFNVRVFNVHAPMNSNSSTKACYRKHRKEKRSEYETNSRSWAWHLYSTGFVNQWVMATLGNSYIQMTMAGLIAYKQGQSYSMTLQFIGCKISFSLIDSASMYLRGLRSSFHAPVNEITSVTIQLTLAAERPNWGTESHPACWRSNWLSVWSSYHSPFPWVLYYWKHLSG